MVWFTLQIHEVGMIYAETCCLAEADQENVLFDKLAVWQTYQVKQTKMSVYLWKTTAELDWIDWMNWIDGI